MASSSGSSKGSASKGRTKGKGTSKGTTKGKGKKAGGTSDDIERVAPPNHANPLSHFTKLDVLLVFFPLALIGEVAHWNPTLIFGLSAVGIIPLAGWMGRATEELAIHSGPGVGGLLNASFGNAAEIIIALVALSKGPALYPIVRASIVGSILGNILLVLGLAMFMGGLKWKHQTYSTKAASTSASMMTLAVIGLVVPSMLAYSSIMGATLEPGQIEGFSLQVSVILLAVYALSIIFALVTHSHVFNPAAEAHEHEEAEWSPRTAVMVLVGSTALLGLLAEVMVGAVEHASHDIGLSEIFVGVIIVAIVGNAAEHSSAVLMAMRNKMDIAMTIASGASAQIALFVAPLVVLASLAMGGPVMTLTFEPMAIISLGVAVAIANMVSMDAESNWLEGTMLLAVYAILGLFFFYHP